jgi:Ser/Thr protein kinase RdoA (MazF antagonist)
MGPVAAERGLAHIRAALAAWDSVAMVGPLGGGNRTTAVEVRRGGERLVAHLSRRSPASLDWQIRLVGHLARHGLVVPAMVQAGDGRYHVDGVTVERWLDGRAPGPADWPAVVTTLRRLHELTAGWPQRPGFASTRELLSQERGGDVDLSLMPAGAVAACRQAWAGLAAGPHTVVHGDPGPANIRITSDGVGLLDWDEARVDHPDLDLADLSAEVLPPARLAAAHLAVRAWEAASGWVTEPSYARNQLALLNGGR